MIFRKKEQKLVGEIAQFRVVMDQDRDYQDLNQSIDTYEYFLEQSDEISRNITSIAREELGKEFSCESVVVVRGSVEVIYLISATYAFYLGFSKYKNFIESLNIFKGQVDRMLVKMGPIPMKIRGSTIEPLKTLLDVDQSQDQIGDIRDCNICSLLWLSLNYIIVTHAILLTLTIYLLVK